MADISRFISAQKRDYHQALTEIKAGRKRSHWIWYIFPQIDGLGYSSTARFYAIKDLDEARAFLSDPYLGRNLIEISEALLTLDCSDPSLVMGYPDDLKLCSSMTLFSIISEENSVFSRVLDKFYGGRKDGATLRILGI